MKVPLAKPFYDEREELAVALMIRSGWVSQGPRVLEFEQCVAEWMGMKHVVATNSCTSAMHIVLDLNGVTSGGV